jgi:hypothetical protein
MVAKKASAKKKVVADDDSSVTSPETAQVSGGDLVGDLDSDSAPIAEATVPAAETIVVSATPLQETPSDLPEWVYHLRVAMNRTKEYNTEYIREVGIRASGSMSCRVIRDIPKSSETTASRERGYPIVALETLNPGPGCYLVGEDVVVRLLDLLGA